MVEHWIKLVKGGGRGVVSFCHSLGGCGGIGFIRKEWGWGFNSGWLLVFYFFFLKEAKVRVFLKSRALLERDALDVTRTTFWPCVFAKTTKKE